MDKTALGFKLFVTDEFGIYLVCFYTRFDIFIIRRVGNTAGKHRKGCGLSMTHSQAEM